MNIKTLKKLQKDIHENAKAHGFWEDAQPFGVLIALVHSELSEALESYRTDPWPKNENRYGEDGKPEGIPSELADVVIRVMDICEYYGIDLEKAILEKYDFNKTRPYKHGGKTI